MGGRDIIQGVDQPLPEGERLLWQGRPDTRVLARRVFRVHLWGGYFLALAVASLFIGGPGSPLARAVWLLVLGGVVTGMAVGYAWLTARNSVYAITDRRVVMKVGLAFPAFFNLPLDLVGEAFVRRFGDGSGDLAVEISGGQRIGYIFMWPHVRPWRLKDPQPMLRGLADVAAVAQVFKGAAEGVSRKPVGEGRRRPARYSLFDDDGIEVLSNRAPERQVQAT